MVLEVAVVLEVAMVLEVAAAMVPVVPPTALVSTRTTNRCRRPKVDWELIRSPFIRSPTTHKQKRECLKTFKNFFTASRKWT